jgi:phytoene dehydrogenase-like protein
MSNYRTPIDALYLTGPGVWPGGDVRLTPGYNTARALIGDVERGTLTAKRRAQEIV